MKCLLIVADSSIGGLGAVVRGHAEWFSNRNWRVLVASKPHSSLSRLTAKNDHSVQTVLMDMPNSVRDVSRIVGVSRQLRRLYADFPADIVHCHGVRSLVVARLAGIVPVVTVHGGLGSVTSDPTAYRTVRRLGLALTPSLSKKSFSATPEYGRGWTFLPHASPRLASLKSLSFPPHSSCPTFLWIGRLEEPKRPDIFVRAIAQVAETKRVAGIVLGDGSLKDSLTELVNRLNAPVDFVGETDDIESYLRGAWGVALFSGYEALSFSLQEAMWVGRTVVASRLPGLAWLAREGGLLVDNLSEAVEAFIALTDPSHAANRGSSAAKNVRRLLKPDMPWPTVEAAYEELGP